MNNILLIGAGRSASTLIKYLLDNSTKENFKITVADISIELAAQKINNHPNACAI
ncbi:MAG TPA: saccharopine dehydrogenase, partial [Bacteroidia bacterium]